MATKKHKKVNSITRKYKNSSLDIDTLQTFLNTLKTSDNPKCVISKNCITPDSKSGQKILICKKSVFKAPPIEQDSRIEWVNKNTIKIDNFNMNLLIQSVIRTLPKSIRDKVEHYNQICSLDNQYLLESNRYGYSIKKKTFNSLQDYLLYSNNIDIDQVCKWLEEIAKILNILYDKMQFHHADSKAAQIFLTDNGKVVLGDLDKVTFTLNINNQPYRIRLTHLPYRSYMQNIVTGLAPLAENLNFLSSNEVLRFENKPRASPDLEIASFIASAAILSQSQMNAEIIVEKTKKLYKNYEIILPPDISNIKNPLSLKTTTSFVIPIVAPKYATTLHSKISLNVKKNTINLKYKS